MGGGKPFLLVIWVGPSGFFFFSFMVCVCECVLLGFYWEGVNMCGDDPILHLILESFIRYG